MRWKSFQYKTKVLQVYYFICGIRGCMFNATFDNSSVISWRLVLLVEGHGVHGENHWPTASYWQITTSGCIQYMHLAWAEFELTVLVVMVTYCICSYKSNNHTITTTMVSNEELGHPNANTWSSSVLSGYFRLLKRILQMMMSNLLCNTMTGLGHGCPGIQIWFHYNKNNNLEPHNSHNFNDPRALDWQFIQLRLKSPITCCLHLL